ncbi:YbaY family lipoprotein [Thermaurantiacus sp.]
MPSLPAYICPNGRLVEVRENPAAGTLEVENGALETTAFKAAGTAGTYVAGELTLTVTPEQLTIRGGSSATMMCPRRPQAPTPGILWGSIDKRDRLALPPGSRARVLLADVSRMDAAAEEIASSTITTAGNQVPLHFLLRFDPARITPGRIYAVSARLEFPDGSLGYITDTRNRVLAEGPAAPALELQLVPARR